MKKNTKQFLQMCALAAGLAAILIAPTAWAQVPGDAAILEWDSSGPLAQEYRVYRAASQIDGTCSAPVAGYQLIETVDAPTLTYTDQPLASNNSYCWFVTAWNVDHGESEASNVVVKRIPFLAVPPAPANLRVR